MTITRRNVLLGAAATAALLPLAARAQTSEVVIGVDLSVVRRQRADGVDAQQRVRDRARHHQQ
jgi:branched-chain amino acid transport system substrate-binding protein